MLSLMNPEHHINEKLICSSITLYRLKVLYLDWLLSKINSLKYIHNVITQKLIFDSDLLKICIILFNITLQIAI